MSNPQIVTQGNGYPRAASEAPHPHKEIARALKHLDTRLEAALSAFDTNHGGAVSGRFRGLYVSPADARSLLHAGSRDCAGAEAAASGALWMPLRGTLAFRLASLFELGQFELDALLIAFAPEFDLRYERLYAYLQDDVTRKRPTIDLVLSLLCASATDRFACRTAFASDRPLISHGLVRLVSDPNQVHPPLLAQYVKPDEQIVRFLLGDAGLDSRLAGCCTVARTDSILSELAIPIEAKQQLARIAASLSASTRACLWFHGPRGAGKKRAVEALAREAGTALLVLDAGRIATTELENTLQLALREAWFRCAVLCVARAECWLREPQAATLLPGTVRAAQCTVVFASTEPLPAEMLGLARPLAFTIPDAAQRAQCWRKALAAREVQLEDHAVAALADRFRLTPAQISSAVSDAVLRSTERAPTMTDLLAAARAQSGHALGEVADKIEPKATWDDIVLPPDAVAQLHELCARVDHHDRVFMEWGFARKLSRGRGTTALFSGGSGTGKTMAAEVIANALGLDLYRVDLARVVSKYIGETEKNLDRVFTAAEGANAILFFDEADALFGKRSEVKDAHDRYANIEISYLLQKMEEYEGVAILATNLVDNLDQGFTRRLAFHVYFPFPDEAARLRLWERAWSAETPLAPAVDRRVLARELRLSGGSIRNVALGAAFLAAGDGGVVQSSHVVRAVRREQQKSGRSVALPVSLAEAKA
jgi:SpoVK/Ycf46/Vps4 family AAA+-type ATPase